MIYYYKIEQSNEYESDDDLDDFLSADEFDSAEEGDFDDDNEEE